MSALIRKWNRITVFVLAACLAALSQDVPDAPQPKPQPPSFPAGTAPAPKNNHPVDDQPQPPETPPPAPKPAQRPGDVASGRDDLYRLTLNVSFVEVPVTVKDKDGRLVEGLSSDDFTVYEDGVPQKLSYFTSDAFPLSTAVVIDTNLPADTMKKISETLPALVGAFSEFDEVALYTYGTTVRQLSNFSASGEIPTGAIQQVKRAGRQDSGVPVIGGPMQQGPTVNGHPVDPSTPRVYNQPPEAHVLNDAILRAAQDLSRRQRGARRRIIFVISDGREYGSVNNYEEVRKILLSQNITVYALGVDTAAIPVYDRLNRIRLPRFGRGDILPKYVVDTGGDMSAEFNRQAIEQAYSHITEVARNQYTLGYNTRSTPSSTYRSIDVHVHRTGLRLNAKDGYYPLPPAQK